jgi:hypothetical protein
MLLPSKQTVQEQYRFALANAGVTHLAFTNWTLCLGETMPHILGRVS